MVSTGKEEGVWWLGVPGGWGQKGAWWCWGSRRSEAGSRREAVGLGTLGDFDCPGLFSGEQQGWRQMVQVWVAS